MCENPQGNGNMSVRFDVLRRVIPLDEPETFFSLSVAQSRGREKEHIVMKWRSHGGRYCGHVANCTTPEAAQAALRLMNT